VDPPLPPRLHEFLPNPTPTKDEIRLNINIVTIFWKLNMTVPVTQMCKILSVRREVLKLLQVLTEKEDTPIILNTIYLDQKRDKKPPFYHSLGMIGLRLNNCMLYSGASTNVMSSKIIEQIGFKMTRPYRNMCGIDSKRVKFYVLCEKVEVFFIDFPHIELLMNIVVTDVLNAWGMLFLRSWYAAFGGFLIMDLTHAHIPMGDDTFEVLYSQE
jgi:hypothetical protein